MGKVLGYAAAAIGIAALIVSGFGVIAGPAALAALTASLGGISAAMLATAAAVLSVGASLLSPRPKPPDLGSATLERLNVTLEPRTPRKAVFGDTAMSTDLEPA